MLRVEVKIILLVSNSKVVVYAFSASTVGAFVVTEYMSCCWLAAPFAIQEIISVSTMLVPYPAAKNDVYVTFAIYYISLVVGRYEI
jgi:hypothetical protein